MWKKVSNGISSRTTSSAPLVVDARFHSAALSREMAYRIYLPHNYLETTRRYPVLYLHHGVYGSFENWDTLTN